MSSPPVLPQLPNSPRDNRTNHATVVTPASTCPLGHRCAITKLVPYGLSSIASMDRRSASTMFFFSGLTRWHCAVPSLWSPPTGRDCVQIILGRVLSSSARPCTRVRHYVPRPLGFAKLSNRRAGRRAHTPDHRTCPDHPPESLPRTGDVTARGKNVRAAKKTSSAPQCPLKSRVLFQPGNLSERRTTFRPYRQRPPPPSVCRITVCGSGSSDSGSEARPRVTHQLPSLRPDPNPTPLPTCDDQLN